jgi:hypothetical protein
MGLLDSIRSITRVLFLAYLKALSSSKYFFYDKNYGETQLTNLDLLKSLFRFFLIDFFSNLQYLVD